MKFALPAIALALAATVASEGLVADDKCSKYLHDIPGCAYGPIAQCASKAGCSPSNLGCSCKKKAQIKKCATGPVKKACSKADAKKAKAATNKICKCEG